jgi:opacity protein-like surface antigen
MPPPQFATHFFVLVFAVVALGGGRDTRAQNVRIEVGTGWVVPTSSVQAEGTVESQQQEGLVLVDLNSGAHVYASAGLSWTVSSNFTLYTGLRAQQSQLRVGEPGLQNCRRGNCSLSPDPDGQLWVAALEGRITLTSVGWINLYFLVSLGVARTTVDGTRVERSRGDAVQLADVGVTDAGGDVGFGASTPLVGDLSINAEIRATGSLPGSKENAVTTFPFSVGLSYEF